MVLKRKPNIFVYFTQFLVGIVLGYISYILIVSEDVNHSELVSDVKPIENINYTKKSVQKTEKIRILCLLNTNPSNHYRVVHVRKTWGRYCTKLIFASTITDVNMEIIGFNVTDSHDFVWTKETMMLQYVYKNFWHHYDWFYKADDDTFAILQNLRYLLTGYSTNDPIFIGYKFHTPIHRWGYCHGGAGISFYRIN